MRRHFADHFEEAYGPDWFDHATARRSDKSGEIRYARPSYKQHDEHVRANERSPRDVFEAGDFPDLVKRKQGDKFVFPEGLRKLSDEMNILRKYRNAVSHAAQRQALKLWDAERALSSCNVILQAISDRDAVTAIGRLQNQLNDLDSKGAPNLAGQAGEPPARRNVGGVGLTRR